MGEAQHARLRLFDLQQGEQIFHNRSLEGQAGAGAGVFQDQIEGIRPVPDRDIPGVQTQLGGVAVFACRLRVALLGFHEALPVQLSTSRQPILLLSALAGRNLDVAGENRAGGCLLRPGGNELEGEPEGVTVPVRRKRQPLFSMQQRNAVRPGRPGDPSHLNLGQHQRSGAVVGRAFLEQSVGLPVGAVAVAEFGAEVVETQGVVTVESDHLLLSQSSAGRQHEQDGDGSNFRHSLGHLFDRLRQIHTGLPHLLAYDVSINDAAAGRKQLKRTRVAAPLRSRLVGAGSRTGK